MKHALLSALFLSVLPLAAETSSTTLPIRMDEQREVMGTGNALLAGTMDLRKDGSARTTHRIGGFSTRIEFKGLAIREIVKLPVGADDAAKGITRRYHARLACKSHRIWDAPMVSWSEWRDSAYGFFPTTLVIEDVNGSLQATAKRIRDFSPGIDGAMTASAK